MGVLGYSHLNAKISAMKGKMLSEDDYEQMMHKSSVSEVATYLRDNTYYGDAFKGFQEVEFHRGHLEVLLYRAAIMDEIKISKYLSASDKSLYRYVYRRQEIEDLKKMLRTLQMGRSLETINPKTLFISKYSKIDFTEALKAKTITELVEVLRHTKFYIILQPLILAENQIDLYSAEMMLDMYYYSRLVKELAKYVKANERRLLNILFGTDADMKNILWIYRAKEFYHNVNKEMVYRYLIPLSHKLSKQDIVNMIEAKTMEDFVAAVNDTPYTEFIGPNPKLWDKDFARVMMKLQRTNALFNPNSIVSVVSYIALKELEISNIIAIIEGVRYRVNPEAISQQIIRKQ